MTETIITALITGGLTLIGVPRWGNVGARRGEGADVGRCRGGGHGLERL